MKKHNHITRDIKPEGKCPACDEHISRKSKSMIMVNHFKFVQIEELGKTFMYHGDWRMVMKTEDFNKLFTVIPTEAK